MHFFHKLVLFLFLIRNATSEGVGFDPEVVTFLEKYGYVNSSEIVDYPTTLRKFQDQYNLPYDMNETLSLIRRPRCMQHENEFRTNPLYEKWNKTHIYWSFPEASSKVLNVARRAFEAWENISVLHFEMISNIHSEPDITISFGKKIHKSRASCMGKKDCRFDENGGTLAHAFFPDLQLQHCVEIHLSKDWNWYYGFNKAPPGTADLLPILTHEIGHTLGIQNSDDEDSIMYPWYQDNGLHMSKDDEYAIQSIYGLRDKYEKIPVYSTLTTTSTTTTSTTKSSFSSNSHGRSINYICQLKTKPDFMFLAYAPEFENYRMYIGYNTLVWKIDINNPQITPAESLFNYLPQGVTAVTHIFQNSDGNLEIYDQSKAVYYIASFPSLQLHKNERISYPRYYKLGAFFKSFSGKIYLFYNNLSFIEYSNGSVVSRGQIKDKFPGLPPTISSAFSYIDGHIYFFDDNSYYYKYNEFQKKVIEVGPFNWNIFNIPCPDTGVFDQLKNLLTKITSLYDH